MIINNFRSVADPSNMPPVQNVFYRHTLLSLARLNNVNAQSKEKTIVTTNSKSKVSKYSEDMIQINIDSCSDWHTENFAIG